MLPPKSDPDYEERLKLLSNVRDKWDPRTKDSTVIPESMRYNGSISTWPLPILRGISALASDTPGDEAWNQVYDLLEEGQKKRMKRITKMSNILPAQVQLSDLEYVRPHYVQGKPIEHKLIGKDERENDAGSYRAPYRRRAEMTSWETDFRSYTRARRAFPPWPKQPAIDPDSLTMASRENMNQVYTPKPDATEPANTQAIISALNLQKHVEGGYYAEIDRNPLTIPNPFLSKNGGDEEEDVKNTADKPMSGDNAVRNASTSIYYMLSAVNPQGHFHRNKGRTIHTLISGRGRYVLIHADEAGAKKRIETFVVGHDVANGEKSVWIVEGGKYKASFLLDGAEGERLLISETVIPGFEFSDHDFLTKERFEQLVTTEQAKELEWLVRKS